MELDAAGLPVREADEGELIGSVRLGRSDWRVRIVEGERGGVTMPLVDIREYVLEESPERSRYHAPKAGGRGKVRGSFSGWTKKGLRVTSDGAEMLAELIAQAAVKCASQEEEVA